MEYVQRQRLYHCSQTLLDLGPAASRVRAVMTGEGRIATAFADARAVLADKHAGQGGVRITAMESRRSLVWSAIFPFAYAFIRGVDPLMRWAWFSVGIGITSRLTVAGRRTGRERSVLVGLVRVGGAWYVGHPNGEVGWTTNLRAAGVARIALRPEAPIDVRATPLQAGSERTQVILAAGEQQPFPANLLYLAARRHILAAGRYFRLDPGPPKGALTSRHRHGSTDGPRGGAM